MQTKKTYESPTVAFYGNVEEITFGPGNGNQDALFGADGGLGGVGGNRPPSNTGS